MSIARWNLKEAEGKALARRKEIVYKAVAVGKKSNIFKAQYLYGNCGRRCGGYKCEGHVHYPGRSDDLPLATAIVRWWDGLSEVSRGHTRLLTGNRRVEPVNVVMWTISDYLEQMPARGLKPDVADSIR